MRCGERRAPMRLGASCTGLLILGKAQREKE
jgi:hypothetical protein